MAARTVRRTPSDTWVLPLTTLDTVARETPARAATSSSVQRSSPGAARSLTERVRLRALSPHLGGEAGSGSTWFVRMTVLYQTALSFGTRSWVA